MSIRLAAIPLMLSACAPQGPGAPYGPAPDTVVVLPSGFPPQPAPPALAAVTTLAGEWRVAAVDGAPIQGSVGLALRGDAREIWWEPRCAGYVRSYAIHGPGFSSGPYVGFKPRLPGEPTPPVCAIATPRAIGDIFAALASATTILRTANNGVEISGGGHSLLLFSQ